MFELYPEQRAEGEILLDGDNILTNTQDIALLRAKVFPVILNYMINVPGHLSPSVLPLRL